MTDSGAAVEKDLDAAAATTSSSKPKKNVEPSLSESEKRMLEEWRQQERRQPGTTNSLGTAKPDVVSDAKKQLFPRAAKKLEGDLPPEILTTKKKRPGNFLSAVDSIRREREQSILAELQQSFRSRTEESKARFAQIKKKQLENERKREAKRIREAATPSPMSVLLPSLSKGDVPLPPFKVEKVVQPRVSRNERLLVELPPHLEAQKNATLRAKSTPLLSPAPDPSMGALVPVSDAQLTRRGSFSKASAQGGVERRGKPGQGLQVFLTPPRTGQLYTVAAATDPPRDISLKRAAFHNAKHGLVPLPPLEQVTEISDRLLLGPSQRRRPDTLGFEPNSSMGASYPADAGLNATNSSFFGGGSSTGAGHQNGVKMPFGCPPSYWDRLLAYNQYVEAVQMPNGVSRR